MNIGVIIAIVIGFIFLLIIGGIGLFMVFGIGGKSKPQSSTSGGSGLEPDVGGTSYPLGNAAPAGSNTSKGIILWKDQNYIGSSVAYGPGDHTLIGSDIKNDASSIQVSPGCSVTVWDKDDYSGSSATYNISTDTLKGTGLNNDIASLRVQCTY